ncbi:hypothetical protein CPB84DRAFT_1814337 [Gymnopilus junonius]|uniref:CxC6 like cysteine cluster associated with KDZ domain-containing protein n=1 Tax=Gymnopilus junonius TaxID=109634 RepID=A0A9P5TQX6_GYMJU|nr:hypothetical protein CPB84DRAFT_1814337 [Gymnopilus junonius]
MSRWWVVLDGIVMGPTHCAYDSCYNDLSNSRGGSLCNQHYHLLASWCLGTSACQDHQTDWNTFRKYSHHNVCNPPLPPNYFSPGCYYCVEMICAPCGVVIAWTKFAHSESTTNILNFLASVYPTQDSWPDYICINKAFTNGSWEIWKHTSQFIVDTYHYINHCLQDYLCQTYCSLAPANNVAPNLVIVEYDSNGQPYSHWGFNTQSIAKWMTPGNFNWFIHVMLFYHTKYTIKKQQKKQSNQEAEDGDIGLDEETETEEEEGSDEE